MPGAEADAHGGPDAAGVPRHDFSTNANACGPCPGTLAAVRRADARHYPDPGYTALRAELARFHGVDAARIVLAASGSEFIARITAAVARGGARSVWMPAACYGDYARAAQAWGLGIDRSPVPSSGAALLWCCDPSSPTGQPQPGLAALLDGLDPHAGTCVLDLAYEPLRLAGSLSLDDGRRERAWQLWTPNKALGLTGVRGAYVIAPTDGMALAARMNALCPSWPLGAHAVAMLADWTTDATRQWLAGTLPTLRAWKARQLALCESIGWRCLPGDANFFCAEVGLRALPPLLAHCRSAGIKLRDAGPLGLPGHVRLGVLPPASQDALRARVARVPPD